MKRLLSRWCVLQSLLVACAVLATAPPTAPRERGETLAIVGAKIYPAPSAPPIQDGVVLVVNGKIEKADEQRKVRVPRDAKILDAHGLTLVAGFWNSHVHFTGAQWKDAAHQPAAALAAQLQRMLTGYGFTTVFDIASVLENTKALRHRIDSGDVAGPRIFSTGEPLFPKNGVPIYVKTVISAELYDTLKRTAEVETADEARAAVDARIDAGADAIKIFAGSWLGGDSTVEMPLEVVKAATVEAHRRGKVVFAHPQTRAGLENAVAGGVDILAHTTPTTGAWNKELLARMKLSNVALIPTLTLWDVEAARGGATPEATQHFISAGVEQLRAFMTAGGRVLFGTDVGYTDHDDTAEELDLMSKAGMTFQDILTSLTTAPAARFGELDHVGRVVPGYDADLVLLQGDPASDAKAFAAVKYTLRAGKIIYQRP